MSFKINQREATVQIQHPVGFTNLKLVFFSIWEQPGLKSILAFLGLIGSWIFGGQGEALLVVFTLVIFDTIAGATLACKNKELSSAGFFRFAAKVTVYLILMATASLMDKALPIQFGSAVMYTFLAATEGLSIMENLSMLGFAVPLKFIKLLKVINDPAYKKGLKKNK